MDPSFNVSTAKFVLSGKLLKHEQGLLIRLIEAQRRTGGLRPLKPERYKEEPRKWYWEMQKQKNDISEPHPFCPYLRVQRTVSRLLLEGKKIPWVFREYGVHAEENIHETGNTIG